MGVVLGVGAAEGAGAGRTDLARRGHGDRAGYADGSIPESPQILQVLRTSRRALHCAEVVDCANSNLCPPERNGKGLGREFCVCEVCLDARHLLHDVQRAVVGLQAKVGSFSELSGVGRIEGKYSSGEKSPTPTC